MAPTRVHRHQHSGPDPTDYSTMDNCSHPGALATYASVGTGRASTSHRPVSFNPAASHWGSSIQFGRGTVACSLRPTWSMLDSPRVG